jgi:spermidine/putrescine transport system permease protein
MVAESDATGRPVDAAAQPTFGREIAEGGILPRGRHDRFDRATTLQLAPASLLLLIFLVGPIAVFFVYSFWTIEGYDLVSDWTFANYREALTDEIYRTLFAQTLATAFLAAAVTTLIAYVFAHALRFHLRHHQERLLFLVVVALFSGYLVRIYAWRTILGDEGVINEALRRLGLIEAPLSFLLFSRVATTIVLVNFLIPLAILPIYAALQNVRDEEIEAARDLGATAFGAFRRVTLPLAWGGVFAAFSLTLIIAAGDYVTPQLVGGTKGSMIGRTIASSFGTAFNWPLGAALSFLTLAFVLAILGVLRLGSARVVR